MNNIVNYEPGTHYLTLTHLNELIQNYDTLRADETLPTRMSHYNQNWESKDQILYDSLHNQNNRQFNQIIWNVYNFGTTGKTTVQTDDGELKLPEAVAPAFKKQYESLEQHLGDKATEAFSSFYKNSRAKQLLETKFQDDYETLEQLSNFETALKSNYKLKFK